MHVALDKDLPLIRILFVNQDPDVPSILRVIAGRNFNEITDFHFEPRSKGKGAFAPCNE
tara:strand:- start:25 stop:201 length:177 start_codon:yes stop_codon:yes gene_type:complete